MRPEHEWEGSEKCRAWSLDVKAIILERMKQWIEKVGRIPSRG
jgi:hypothetical protein